MGKLGDGVVIFVDSGAGVSVFDAASATPGDPLGMVSEAAALSAAGAVGSAATAALVACLIEDAPVVFFFVVVLVDMVACWAWCRRRRRSRGEVV